MFIWFAGCLRDMKGSTYIINSNRDGQRVDNFLLASLKGVPRSHIYRLLRTGKVRVNGKRVKQTYRLEAEDEISVPVLRTSPVRAPVIPDGLKSLIQSSILYEDESVLALNKPAGIAVHPGNRVSFGVIEVLRISRPNTPFLELAHRLDRHTSGCLLVAKNKNMLNELHELLRAREMKKEYLALVKGQWKHGEKTILAPLKEKSRRSENPVANSPGSKYKTAVSYFLPHKVYAEYSLMKIRIGTGRTHQIRIHAAQAGYPIAGDQKYGDYAFNRACRKNGLKRMFLHAVEVEFQCRSNGAKYAIKAPVDAELKGFLESLTAKS